MAVCLFWQNETTLKLDVVSDPMTCAQILMTRNEHDALFAFATAWQFNGEALAQAFGGGLLLWSVGLGVGLVISIVRKLRAS